MSSGPAKSESRSRDYYDEFSATYEKQRHHGYHALIDELELSVTQEFCSGRVLEAGCGTGLILRGLERLTGEAVVGVDLSSGMLSVARNRGLRAGLVQASVDALPFPDAWFDTVVSFKVLAHVPAIAQALSELGRVTRPGGHLILEFYNRHSLRALVKRLKPPTRIGQRYSDEDVFTRFDTLSSIKTYLPRDLDLLDTRGVRVLTPIARLHDIPLVRQLLSAAERAACRAPVIRNLAGFLVAILQKR